MEGALRNRVRLPDRAVHLVRTHRRPPEPRQRNDVEVRHPRREDALQEHERPEVRDPVLRQERKGGTVMAGTGQIVPRFHQIQATTTVDQVGREQVAILGLDALGTVWIKVGVDNWKLVSRKCDDPKEGQAWG